jgi:ectoine hydroxylase-related dioxygenase (phytanoyl-CoA dioxygenase family)
VVTQEQKRFFDVFGFLVLRQQFSTDEVKEIAEAFDTSIEQARNGAPFTGERRQMVIGIVEHNDRLSELMEDDRIYNVIADLLGPELTWVTSDGNLYVGNTDWHPDAHLHTYQPVKVAIYLDPVKTGSGALRVIPGSHKEPFHDSVHPARAAKMSGVLSDDGDGEGSFGVGGTELPHFALESEPGDLVMFRGGLYHASYGGGDHRRMFTLNFGARPRRPDEVKFHRDLYEKHLGWVRDDPYKPRSYVYGEQFLTGGGVRRQQLVQQLCEWGFK